MSSLARPNCTSLELLNGFDDYLREVRLITKFDPVLIESCSTQICGAIWGESNPDISGIGISIGYVLEVALGLLFAVSILSVRQRKGPRWEFYQLVTKAGFEAFFGSAMYFAISLEVAAIYMLVNKDFGVSTLGLGDSEARIILAVSVVCILPLLYAIALLPARSHHPEPQRHDASEMADNSRVDPGSVRLTLFALLSLLFFYPFLSQCIHNWAPSRIGEGKGPDGETLASEEEWDSVESICLGSERLSGPENRFLAVWELISSMTIFLVFVWSALEAGIQTMIAQDQTLGEERRITVLLLRMKSFVERPWKNGSAVRMLLMSLPTVLAIPLLWGIFRLRSVQAATLERLEVHYSANDWGFGQVVGIVIFAPVVTDTCFAAWAARNLLGK